ncbi:hypothetical protein FN846DRAFT_29956 [Sphaerosporella brunnea]|uniref:Uncharacterized protein n=1 Tax=Sphaerosporella brunnea TaxID=1250544 RepID=A0A5J5EVX1_9PEZI|nr:hypothetical protein FN846DRAFT_29956 [Sphaerosporella brunnea]
MSLSRPCLTFTLIRLAEAPLKTSLAFLLLQPVPPSQGHPSRSRSSTGLATDSPARRREVAKWGRVIETIYGTSRETGSTLGIRTCHALSCDHRAFNMCENARVDVCMYEY